MRDLLIVANSFWGIAIAICIAIWLPDHSMAFIRYWSWPTVVLVIAFIYKKQLSDLIDSAEEVTFSGSNKLKLNRKVVEAAEEEFVRRGDVASEADVSDATDATDATDTFTDRVDKLWYLKDTTPDNAIIDSWKLVYENLLDKSIQLGHIESGTKPATPYMLGMLTKKQLISKEYAELLLELFRKRNAIFKGIDGGYTDKAARRYLALCLNLITAIQGIDITP